MSDVETISTLQPASEPDWQVVQSSIKASLEQAHGPLLTGEGLANALGYRNLASLRQAKKRNQVGVPLFELPNRKGLYALTAEVADWLATCRLHTRQASGSPNKEMNMP